MASITSLANETLYWVMREFCPHCVVGCGVFGAGSGACLESLDHASVLAGDRRAEARRTLLALTRVGNRRLGRVAQLFLFHVVDTDRGDSLALLARTLAEAPALALEIRVVDLGGVAVAGSGGSAVVTTPTAAAAPAFAAVVPAAGLAPAATPAAAAAAAALARAAAASAQQDVFTLFSQAKKIQAVVLRGAWPLDAFSRFPTPAETQNRLKIKLVGPTTIRLGLDRSIPLDSIRELRLTGGYATVPPLGQRNDTVDLNAAKELLCRLTSLRRLSVCGALGSFWTDSVGDTLFQNLTALELPLCSLGLRYFEDILESCTPGTLKRFTFSCGQAGDASTVEYATGSVVLHLLNHYGHAQNLESLELDTSKSGWWMGWMSVFQRTVKSVCHFSSLRHLSISADSIYSWGTGTMQGRLAADKYTGLERLVEFLPSSLQSLEITAIWAIPIADVRMLAEDCEAEFPELTKVVLKRCDLPGPNAWPYFDYIHEGETVSFARVPVSRYHEHVELEEMFAAAGVEFVLV